MWEFFGGGITSRGRSFLYNLPREIKLEICRLLDLCHVSCGKFIFFFNGDNVNFQGNKYYPEISLISND